MIKFIIYIILFLNAIKSSATNHYFSATGSDGNSGLILLLPQKSIAKLNTNMAGYKNGDSILFKCGDTFYGSIIVSKVKLNFGSYGRGAKPIISGFTIITEWTNAGSHIWESSAINTSNKPNLVLINNEVKAMGRWPNTGYNFYSTFTTSYIKDVALSGKNFEGGRLCIRKLHDIISNDSITSHNGNTLYSTSISGYNTLAGYGYFIENHPNTLDLEGEWYFNPYTKKLKIYSSSPPTSVKISTIDTLCYLGANDNITITGISFQGSNVAGVAFGGPSVGQAVRDTIKGCSFFYSGRNAIYCTFNKYCTIQDNLIYYSLNNGVYCESQGGRSLNVKISYNTIKYTGTLPGMGYINTKTKENLSYNAIIVKGDSAVVSFNTIDTVGHVGIAGFYSNNKINNNNINYHNFITDDGGGINFFDITFGKITETGIDIVSNTVSNAIGAAIGTADNANVANGIYLDDKINGVRIDSNSIFNIANIGIYFHNVTDISARKNTISDCTFSAFGVSHDKHAQGIPINNLTFTGNTIIQSTGYIIYMYNFIDGGNLDSIFFKLDRNTYYKSSLTEKAFRTLSYDGKTWYNQNLNFSQWKTAYLKAINGSWDKNSTLQTKLPEKAIR